MRPYKLQYWDGDHSYWLMRWQGSFAKLESAIERAWEARRLQAQTGYDWHYRVIDTREVTGTLEWKVVFSTKDETQA